MASSILDFERRVAGETVVVNALFTLTPDDLLVLAARDDSGWHLGWFNRTLRGVGHDPVAGRLAGEAPFVDTLLLNTRLPSAGALVTQSGTPFGPLSARGQAGQSVDSIPMPEPASILLLGSGLAVFARRIRKRRD